MLWENLREKADGIYVKQGIRNCFFIFIFIFYFLNGRNVRSLLLFQIFFSIIPALEF